MSNPANQKNQSVPFCLFVSTFEGRFSSYEETMTYLSSYELKEKIIPAKEISFSGNENGIFSRVQGFEYPMEKSFFSHVLSWVGFSLKTFEKIQDKGSFINFLSKEFLKKFSEGEFKVICRVKRDVKSLVGCTTPSYNLVRNYDILKKISDDRPNQLVRSYFTYEGEKFDFVDFSQGVYSPQVNDDWRSGFSIENSEGTKEKSLSFSLYFFRLVCRNGLMVKKENLGKKFYHTNNVLKNFSIPNFSPDFSQIKKIHEQVTLTDSQKNFILSLPGFKKDEKESLVRICPYEVLNVLTARAHQESRPLLESLAGDFLTV